MTFLFEPSLLILDTHGRSVFVLPAVIVLTSMIELHFSSFLELYVFLLYNVDNSSAHTYFTMSILILSAQIFVFRTNNNKDFSLQLATSSLLVHCLDIMVDFGSVPLVR